MKMFEIKTHKNMKTSILFIKDKTRKNSFFIVLFLLSIFSFQKSIAQVDVTIGTGTSTTYYNPVYSGFSNSAYSYTQQLYLASEIGGGNSGQQITAISFYVASGETAAGNKTWVVYLGNTTKTSFSSTDDFVPAGSMTQVFTGTFNSGSSTGWVSINLSTPFTWNGSNLVVAVAENSSGYGSSTSYRFSTAANCAIYKSSNALINPSSPGTFTNLNSNRPNIKLTMMPPPPTTLWSQTFSSSAPSNVTSSSSWSTTSFSSYVCEGSYAYYSTAGSGNYFATSDFHVPRGKGVKITFDAKRSSSTSRITLYARVGGFAYWSDLSKEYSGWMQLHNYVSVSTTCTNYEVTVPGDICGGQDLSICFTANDNNVGIDNIQITDAGPLATVPNIASTSLTYNFNSSVYFYGPYDFSNLRPSATGNIFSYRSYRPSGGDAYALINSSGGNGGKVNQSPVSGDFHSFLYKNSGEPSEPAPSGLPCFITKEFNTSTCSGTTATLRFAFFTTVGFESNEDYRPYCPRVYYATTTDGTSGYTWTQATVNYYFPNGKWWYATTSLPKAQNLIVAFAAKSSGDDYTNIDDIKIVNNDCSICTLNGGAISCTSNPGLSTYAPNTPYTFTIAATTGANYYKWIIRDLTTTGNPIYYGTTASATPAVTANQGSQTVTINFGTSTSNTYRVMCIPYDENPGTDAAPTDACYGRLSYYSDITPLAGCTDPTLTGASQASAVCGSGPATVNLTGMVANSTGNAIDYTINGVAQTQVTGINANASGNASFSTASLTTANNGQALVITKITNGGCSTNFSQSLTLQVETAGSWTGAVSTDWNTSGNWSCNTLPTSTTDVTIPVVSNLPVVNTSGSAVCRNITIDANASVTVNTGKDLSVYGNWTNNGVSDVGTGTVIFTGSSAQSVSGTTNFENLTLNKASNTVTLTGNTQVKGVLLPSAGTLASNGYLTLVSTATQTALIAAGSGTVSGNVTMQRYMDNRMGYHYYSSPFTGAPVSEFADEMGPIISGNPYIGNDTTQTVASFPNFFAYDETMGPYMSLGWTDAGTTLQPMRGYCVNFGASSGALTTDISGEVNNGTQTYGVTKTTTSKPSADGWNLVGNPYPSPVDWQSAGWTKTYINNAIYYFNPSDQYTGSYSSFVNNVGTPAGTTGIIAAMQGFFVRATGSGNLSVTDAARVNDLNPTFYKALSNNPLLRLQGYSSQNSSYSDETVIYFDPQATGDFDGNYDAYKMMNNNPNLPNVYTSYNASSALSINGMPPLSNTDVVIPLGFITQTNGNFAINASEMINFDPSLHIYLEDNQMSTIQDLTINPTYTFSMNANAPQYRFFIRFSPSVLTGIEENGSSFVDAWASGKDIYVNYSNSSLQPAKISVYNMLGQTVVSGRQEGCGTMRYTVDKPGCYIVNIISNNGNYQKKVVIL